MKSHACVLSLVIIALSVQNARAQFYAITKNQRVLQSSATVVAPDPLQPFFFEAFANSSVTLTMPGGATIALPATGDAEDPYRLERSFSNKAALDAGFPNGTYQMSGPGIPNLSLPLTGDAYSSTQPQVTNVTNGTWANGILVVNPSQPVTLNFSTFSDYASAPGLAHIGFYLWGLMDDQNTGTNVEYESFSRAGFGGTVTATPLTSYTIPAGTLRAGRVYESELWFDIGAGDTSSVPGAVVGTLFSRIVRFYVAALNPGSSAPAPVIIAQPSSRSAVLGGSTSFAVGVSIGGAPATWQNAAYRWRHGVEEIDLGNSSTKYVFTEQGTLTVNNLVAADAGEYSVTIASPGGVVHSAAATLSFATAAAPVITSQPRGATVNAGTTVALTVAATGNPTPTFQWRKDDAIIAGATTETLVLTNITAASAGNYTVVVSNATGSVISNAGTLVVTSNQPSRLPNLSVRTNLAAAQTLFVGFATTGSKSMLVRAVGPTLGVFGLDGTHPDPFVELYDSSSAKIDENNDWNAALTSVFVDNGAFPLTTGSKDAALRRTCSGAYTAQIKGAGAGVLLVEAYDTGGTGKLVNVSARNQVGTDDNILITGFVVDGGAAKTLLIRGVGAKLAEFGVSGVLADPKLEIYTDTGAKIAENDNWNAQLQSVARSVGAFDLTPNSRDAALLLTLAPGAYTAQLSGVARTTGEALVEVYEVP